MRTVAVLFAVLMFGCSNNTINNKNTNSITKKISNRCELQLFALNNYKSTLLQKKILASCGYRTKITKIKKNGVKLYRIRFMGRFSKEEATKIGEKLVKEIPSIKEYWVEKV